MSAIDPAFSAPDGMDGEGGPPDGVLPLLARLQKLAEEQVALRQPIEDRWIEDMRAYQGEYDADTARKLNELAANRSKVFVRATRNKTNAWEARMIDMLFPTEDKNWGISPTPVPSLTREARHAADQRLRMLEEANRLEDEAAASMQREDVAAAELQKGRSTQLASEA